MNTLVIFAREPHPGRVKTRLAASVGSEAACRVYRAFLRDTARRFGAAVEGPPPLAVQWWVDGDPGGLAAILGTTAVLRRQESGDLGSRLAHAVASAFRETGGPVGVIGTDCPEITRARVDALFASLDHADAALIPATDGGYVALALARRTDAAFRGIPWSTGDVLAATRRALEREGLRVSLAPPLSDVDTLGDLEHLARRLSESPSAAPETAAELARLELSPRPGSPP